MLTKWSYSTRQKKRKEKKAPPASKATKIADNATSPNQPTPVPCALGGPAATSQPLMKAASNKSPPPSKASSPEKAEATHEQVSPGKEPKVDTTRKNGTSVEKRAGKAKKHDEAPPKSSSPG